MPDCYSVKFISGKLNWARQIRLYNLSDVQACCSYFYISPHHHRNSFFCFIWIMALLASVILFTGGGDIPLYRNTSLQRELSLDREPPRQRPPWIESFPQTETPRIESPLDTDHLNRDPPDRDPSGLNWHLVVATEAGSTHPTGMHTLWG